MRYTVNIADIEGARVSLGGEAQAKALDDLHKRGVLSARNSKRSSRRAPADAGFESLLGMSDPARVLRVRLCSG